MTRAGSRWGPGEEVRLGVGDPGGGHEVGVLDARSGGGGRTGVGVHQRGTVGSVDSARESAGGCVATHCPALPLRPSPCVTKP